MIQVFMLAGTGHGTTGEAISDALRAFLPRDRFTPHYIPYPAAYGGDDVAYGRSRQHGEEAIKDAIARADGPVWLAGYSQGAGIVGDVAREINVGAYHAPHVQGAALIADPYRPRGAGGTGKPFAPHYGIAGPRTVSGGSDQVRAIWASVASDVITACPPGNPLRGLADITEWFSLRTPEEALAWGADILSKIIDGQLQPWWSVDRWQDWGGAAAYMRGYLFDGRHTRDYLSEGHVEALAAQMIAASR